MPATTTTTPSTSTPITAAAVPYIPAGLTPLVTQLVVTDAKAAIAFYERAFGALLLHSMPMPDGKIMHAALQLGEAVLFINDVVALSKPTRANSFVYLKNLDEVYARAVAAGATVLAPLADMFWGDRWCLLADPFGNEWQLAKHVEDVSPEEMQRRMAAAAPQ